MVGGIAGGITNENGSWGWDWERAAAGALGGALIGAGVGTIAAAGNLSVGGALIGAGIGGIAGSGLLGADSKVDWSGFAWGAFQGGLIGLGLGNGLGGLLAKGAQAAATGTVGSLALMQGGKALVGAVHGGVDAYLHGGNVVVAAGMGMAFGAIDPTYATFFRAGGSVALASVGGAIGGSEGLVRGWDIGDIAGGLAGSFHFGAMRTCVEGSAWRKGLGAVLPDLVGGSVGGLVAYAVGGDPIAGVRQGQMFASLAVAGARWFQKACFAAGTPLLTPEGAKPIGTFRIGDVLLSGSEFDPDGPVESKVVEEVFVRTARIMNLHVGGEVIRTTAEHPFYVLEHGWTPGGELREGEHLIGLDGQWVRVKEVYDTGEYDVVYNLKVSEFSTYFVGGEDWGFSVWAHNMGGGCEITPAQAKNLTSTQKRLIAQARSIREGMAEIDPSMSRNVMAAEIQIRRNGGKLVTLSESFSSDPRAARPTYVRGSQSGMHSEDLLAQRLQRLERKGWEVVRVDAFSERNACPRCWRATGGAIDQILTSTNNNFRMDHAVRDTTILRETNSFWNNIRPSDVDKSKVFLADWWNNIGAKT